MNVIPSLSRPPPPRGWWLARAVELLLGRAVTLALAVAALGLGIATFVVLARGSPVGLNPNLAVGLVLANLAVLLLLGMVLAGRLTRVWVERRRGSAGARLHVRLVLLFGGVAVVPAIVVAVFATAFFHYGIEAWFNQRVRTALNDSLSVSKGYLAEHENNIRVDALAMAVDLARAGRILAYDPQGFARFLASQTNLRGLDAAVIIEPTTGQVVASAGLLGGMGTPPPPSWASALAMEGSVAVMQSAQDTEVRALVKLDATPPLLLLISRPVDPAILAHIAHVEQAVAAYNRLDRNRYGLQVTFALIFATVALLVLFAAVLIGLVFATQIVRPIGALMQAAERVRGGDLAVRVPEGRGDDEIASLSRAFNRMTGQLGGQRAELMDAYSQIDERRRFTESVLSGVSAGVIGLDAEGRIELPNRAAGELLGCDLLAAIGLDLAAVVPEFAPLLAQVRAQPERPRTAEIEIGAPARRRTLTVRVGSEWKSGRPDGFVVTFDDITALQAAQRKAAWADVARRIAHEIKNPLTPIQLAAERLKRRFTREITSDPEIFAQCADTIVRHVGDIGRMVDEFSAFARMPQPVIRPEDAGRIAREAMVLLRQAHPEFAWRTEIPPSGPMLACDRRLIGQALANLLQNAADAVGARMQAEGGEGHIGLAVRAEGASVLFEVTDDGIGLPENGRERLMEPYVTMKPKGTGLGLAIVKKILEDHGGTVTLADRAGGRGTVATLALPAVAEAGAAEEAGAWRTKS